MFCFLYAKIFNLDQFCHVIHSYISKPFITQSRVLMTLKKKAFRKHCGKRRKCWQPAFSPFHTMFSTHPEKNFCFKVALILSSANAFNLDKSKILSCCNCHLQMLSNWTFLKFCHLVQC